MNRRDLTAAAAALLFAVIPLFALASEKGNGDEDFSRYAIEQRDKPFELACAHKHAKYLPQIGADGDGRSKLVSISGDGDNGFVASKQSQNRSSYSSRQLTYSTPDVELVADDSSVVRLSELLDTEKPVMLNFIFTTCTTICPVLSGSFKQVQELMGDEVEEVLMVSISIDPEYDTPEKLAQYAERFSAGEQWRFLTGQVGDIIAVEKAFDIYRGSKTNHEPVTFLRSSKDAEWLRIEGFANASEIVAEYHKLRPQDG